AAGAGLTLQGLTIENGNPQFSKVSPGLGGGILQDSGSTLDVENGAISNNQAVTGGGVYPSGTATYHPLPNSPNPLTINNSTISNNTATAQAGSPSQAGGAGLGGGVYADLTGVGSQAVIENSTFAFNSATGGAGGAGADGSLFDLADPGGAGGNGEG